MDTITLAAVLADVNRALVGKTVAELVTLGRDAFALRFTRKQAPDLVYRAAAAPALYLAKPRAPSRELPTLSGARLLEGATVRSIKQWNDDRLAVAELELRSGVPGRLVLELFRRTGAVYLLDDGDVIVATLWGRRLSSGKYTFPRGPVKAPLRSVTLETIEECFKHEDKGGTLREAVAHVSPVVAGLAAAARAPEDALALLRKLAAAVNEPEPVLVLVRGVWAAYPADIFGDVPVAEKTFFNDISEAVAAAAERAANEALLTKRRSTAARKIRSELRKLERQLRALETELETFKDPERYRELGDLLKIYVNRIRKGVKSIEVEDLFRGGKTVIELEPDLGPQENIASYYKKHRKAKRGRAKTAERITAVRSELERLAAEAERVRTATLDELAPLPDEVPKGAAGPVTRRVGRRYVSSDGFEIIVGQNARENYAVTFQVGRPHDLWLHVREARGSHVIIRRKEKGKEIPKRTVEEAAALAAYHSRARSAGLVPVIVTERRYVQKARGEPGLVRVMREEVLFVEPGEVLQPAPEA